MEALPSKICCGCRKRFYLNTKKPTHHYCDACGDANKHCSIHSCGILLPYNNVSGFCPDHDEYRQYENYIDEPEEHAYNTLSDVITNGSKKDIAEWFEKYERLVCGMLKK